MIVDTKNTISITEANQNFSKAAKMADGCDKLIIYKHNKPAYALINLSENPQIEMSEEERVIFVGQRILHRHIDAFKELAK